MKPQGLNVTESTEHNPDLSTSLGKSPLSCSLPMSSVEFDMGICNCATPTDAFICDETSKCESRVACWHDQAHFKI
jgi:hypothetical protein